MKVLFKRWDRVEYVLKGAEEHYGMTIAEIFASEKRRNSPMKQIIVKLLRDLADVSFKEIAIAVGKNNANHAFLMYETANENYDTLKEFKATYKLIESKLMNYEDKKSNNQQEKRA